MGVMNSSVSTSNRANPPVTMPRSTVPSQPTASPAKEFTAFFNRSTFSTESSVSFRSTVGIPTLLTQLTISGSVSTG